MDLEPSADQLALVAELRRFLADRVPTPAVVTPELWDELAQMGMLTLPVPEADGGVGLGWAEAALAFQELGRSGLAGPFVATAAAQAVGLADGVTGLVPAGTPTLVEHLDLLDSLLVLDTDGVRRVPLPQAPKPVDRPLDPLTSVHVVDDLPVGDEIGASRIGRYAGLMAAAMQVGLGCAALNRAVVYAGLRQQFGRPIGSFQALKHLLADAVVGLEVARAAVDAAAVTMDEDGDVTRAVRSARIVASRASATAARASIQVHGGMGYTWELPAHLYLKRILVLDQTPSGDDAVGA